MYAVIFRAEINTLDSRYSEMASQIKILAIEKYDCTEFVSTTEGQQEIAISYWQSQEQIQQWKHDAKHLIAQELGKSTWYKSYKMQVVKILREYNKKQTQ